MVTATNACFSREAFGDQVRAPSGWKRWVYRGRINDKGRDATTMAGNTGTGAASCGRYGEPMTLRTPATRPIQTRRTKPTTLTIDIGGTGLKAGAIDGTGTMIGERLRVETTYPMTPDALVAAVVNLVKPVRQFDRVSVAFPGVVRHGIVLSAPHFVTKKGPGSAISSELVKAWDRFDLDGAFTKALRKPTRVINDADMQGLDVMLGKGVELVITLGTGIGNAVFSNGVLGPRTELSHHPLYNGLTYNEYVGDAARKKIGTKKWNRRVAKTIDALDALFFFDALYVGGGNAAKLTIDLGPKGKLIDPNAGLLGGIRLWETRHHTDREQSTTTASLASWESPTVGVVNKHRPS